MISSHQQMSTILLIISVCPLTAQLLLCNSETEFECEQNRKCLDQSQICSGVPQCGFLPFLDVSDIEPSLCNNCSLPGLFPCSWLGQLVSLPRIFCRAGFSENQIAFQVCLSQTRYQCDGNVNCDDGSDEAAEICANCSDQNLFGCTWQGKEVTFGIDEDVKGTFRNVELVALSCVSSMSCVQLHELCVLLPVAVIL